MPCPTSSNIQLVPQSHLPGQGRAKGRCLTPSKGCPQIRGLRVCKHRVTTQPEGHSSGQFSHGPKRKRGEEQIVSGTSVLSSLK